MTKLLAAAIAVSLIVTIETGAVAAAKPSSAELVPTYSADEVAWSRGTGPNAIEGSALLGSGETTLTCAGEKVFLRPRSALEDRRNKVVFGSEERARISVLRYMETAGSESPDMPALPKGYDDDARRAVCTADGSFSFAELPDGEYFASVMAFPREYLGTVTPIEKIEVLMRRISVKGGITVKVDLFGRE